MPKLKTRRTLLKRVKLTKTGKVIKRKVGLKHLKIKAGANQKLRANSLTRLGSKKMIKNFKLMLGKHGKNL